MDNRTGFEKNNKKSFGFAVILAVTAILLVGVTVALFVVMNFDGREDTTTPRGTRPTGTVPVGATPGALYPTVPTRESYIIPKNQNAKDISGDKKITSNYSILVELGSYTSIAEKNADEKIYPASMAKVMTLIVACERVTDLDKYLTVKQEYVDYKSKMQASGEWFSAGEMLRVQDVLYLISYDSNSIACQMMADYIAGSEAAFAELMNEKAAAMGLTGTNFTNSTGLHDENNYSTCREIASIMAYAMDNPMSKKLLTQYKGYSIDVYEKGADGKTAKKRGLTKYAGWYSGSARFADKPKINEDLYVIGGKTGGEVPSGITFVTIAEAKDGTKYINVIVTRKSPETTTTLSEAASTAEVKHIYNTYAKKPE